MGSLTCRFSGDVWQVFSFKTISNVTLEEKKKKRKEKNLCHGAERISWAFPSG